MASHRVLDLETVPDYSVWTKHAKQSWEVVPSIGRHSQTSEIIHLHDGRLAFAPAVAARDPFPPPQACRIVAASWIDLYSDDRNFYHLESISTMCLWSAKDPDRSEKDILEELTKAQDADRATLVTWNGRSFDLPVVNLRAMKHGIPCPWYYQDRDVRYRYSEAGHCDVMDVVSDYGACRNISLDDACRLVGLPGKHGDVGGKDVSGLVAKGDDPEVMSSVAEYCESDTIQTALFFIRTRYHKGMINAKEHDAAVRSFERHAHSAAMVAGCLLDKGTSS